ncbi:hypothetical protein PENTCL1PPCAC_15241, partial [Pristionchus entomophagus]
SVHEANSSIVVMGNAQSDERSEPKLSYNDVLGWHVWKQADHAGKDNIVWEIISVRLPSPGTGQSMPRQVYIRNRDGGKYLAEHFDCTTKLVDGCSSQDCVWVLSYGDVEQTFIESNRGNYLSAHL